MQKQSPHSPPFHTGGIVPASGAALPVVLPAGSIVTPHQATALAMTVDGRTRPATVTIDLGRACP